MSGFLFQKWGSFFREHQLRFALALTSVACLFNAFHVVVKLETFSLKYIGNDAWSSHIQQVKTLLESVPKDVVYLGYLSDEEKKPGPWEKMRTARFSRFLRSQFVAAPRILSPSPDYEWVIFQPERTDQVDVLLQQYANEFEIKGDQGNGLMLFKRR